MGFGVCIYVYIYICSYGVYGWLSKLWSLFLGTLNIRCRNIMKDPKREPNIDNHPFSYGSFGILREEGTPKFVSTIYRLQP